MQLALDIELPEEATLDNFCWQGNALLSNEIQYQLEHKKERFFYFWGKKGVGKSHLLQGISHVKQTGATYLPLSLIRSYGPEVLEGMESLSLICLDDIELIAGQKDFEESLFHLYNKCRDNEHVMLFISGAVSPTQLPIVLPDLRSRLAWGLSFEVHGLSEESKLEVLMARAKQKGLNISVQVIQYLLHHYTRDMHHLSELLAKLDKASLEKKRKLTIPFIKESLKQLRFEPLTSSA